jgi:acetyl-CoA/propionyl-CoA carboxylase biotin carboxyl carrier protein
VRVDSGIEPNSVIGGAFDSLLAKLIVWGPSRDEALARARRALDEYVVDGMATALPFHRAVVRDPAFTSDPFTVHTRWIETEFDNQIPPFAGAVAADEDAGERETIVVEVGGKRLEVSLPAGFGAGSGGGGGSRKAAPKRSAGKKSGGAASGDALTAPMQGTIVKVAVSEGDVVAAGDLVVVLEAMKMEQPLNAHKAGTITGLNAEVGAVVTSGAAICDIKD